MTQRRKTMPINFEPVVKVEDAPEETVEAVDTLAEVVKEDKAEVKPEPVKAPEAPKKPEPYVRPAVALPKEGAGRHPRNIPRY
jgi:hypothetical protein